jgi:hypothetical protein
MPVAGSYTGPDTFRGAPTPFRSIDQLLKALFSLAQAGAMTSL